jgi:diguanylate cyclase (GGDEF)-like protein
MKKSKIQILALIDINNFNNINDYYSHDVGDKLLIEFTQLLNNFIDSYSAKLYRFNSDEFYIFSDHREFIRTVDVISKNLLKEIRDYEFKIDDFNISIDVSIGVSYKIKDELNSDMDIFIAADLALKESKLNKSDYILFENNNSYQIEYIENIQMLKTLKDAIKDNRIIIYYQPIIDAKTDKIYSYEVLIRLIDKNGLIISPYYFLEVAKKYKIYTSLTKIVVKQAFEKFANSKKRFSINLSFEDLSDPKIVDYILKTIEHYDCKECVSFEILESESISDFKMVGQFISKVQSYGCRIYIDDFGAGYSNFERLFKLNIDVLKIDGSIIKDIDKAKDLQIITRTIIALAKHSNMKVVAEFVHSKEVDDIVRELGVDFIQGYHYFEPLKDIKN